MFKSIGFRHFKCYRNATAPLGRLTVLVGANNAGKSTIMHSLLMLSQTLASPTGESLVTSGKEVDLGSGADILSAGSGENTFSLQIQVDDGDTGSGIGDGLELTYRVVEDSASPSLVSSSILNGDERLLTMSRLDQDEWKVDHLSIQQSKARSPQLFGFLPLTEFNARESPTNGPASISFRSFFVWRSRFSNIWHSHPVRRDVPQFAQTGKTFDYPPEAGGEPFLMSLRERATSKKFLIDVLNDWIKDHDFMIERLELLPLDKGERFISLLAQERSCDNLVNVANMGRGISQALPVLARVLRSSHNDCGLIEQPELHLHPAAQAELGDAFCEIIKKHSKAQIIVETHSEHLLSRIRRHVARGTLSPDDVSILFIERREGESSINKLALNEDGNFIHWPKGFFQEGFNEALAIPKEAIRRRKSAERASRRRIAR